MTTYTVIDSNHPRNVYDSGCTAEQAMRHILGYDGQQWDIVQSDVSPGFFAIAICDRAGRWHQTVFTARAKTAEAATAQLALDVIASWETDSIEAVPDADYADRLCELADDEDA
jgi:hypothetical protein